MSNNAATNIPIDRLVGPQDVTQFLRGIGDEVSRVDRWEPKLNTIASGDPRDTTSSAAMVDTLQRPLTGDPLSPSLRAQLAEWMTPRGVTGALFRAYAPDGWHVADESRSDRVTRNVVGMITLPESAPYFVAI